MSIWGETGYCPACVPAAESYAIRLRGDLAIKLGLLGDDGRCCKLVDLVFVLFGQKKSAENDVVGHTNEKRH